MILVDTSIWVDHLGLGSAVFARMLDRGQVLCHPWVVGELSLGNLARREETIALLEGLPQAEVATPGETLAAIERHGLYGAGIGYVDAHLLVASMLTPATTLWTADRRLSAVASQLGCAIDPATLEPD